MISNKKLILLVSFILISSQLNCSEIETQKKNVPSTFQKILNKIKIIKEKTQKFFSTKNQYLMVGTYLALHRIGESIRLSKANSNVQLLSSVPQNFQDAVQKMGFAPNSITFYAAPIGCASAVDSNAIAIDTTFLTDYDSQEQTFIICHELAHILHNDIDKITDIVKINIAGIASIFIFEQAIQKLQKKYTEGKNPKIYKFLSQVNYINKFLLHNPLIFFIGVNYFNNKYRQSQEKNADISAATKLNCAIGGISALKKVPKKTRSISYYNPLYLKYKFDQACGFLPHPSPKKRIEYLNALKQ